MTTVLTPLILNNKTKVPSHSLRHTGEEPAPYPDTGPVSRGAGRRGITPQPCHSERSAHPPCHSDRSAHPHCHSERSEAESRNLKHALSLVEGSINTDHTPTTNSNKLLTITTHVP